MRPCVCDNLPPPGEPYTPGYCRLCWLYHHDSAYRACWDAPGPATGRILACRYRGETRGEEQCPSCRGRVRLKVFACALHGECTIARSLAGLACCATCTDYDAGPPVPDVLAETSTEGTRTL